MKKSDHYSKLTIRIPHDVKKWLAKHAEANACSMGSEIVRTLRSSMSEQAKGSS